MAIFRAYDIRGIYPSEINEEIMEKIGRAFADFIPGKKIAVGYDMRLSSATLFSAFVRGVILQGKDVVDFGLTSTPMSYFACNYLKADGCAMITASHNPKEYNGVKLTRKKAIPISGDSGIKDIEKKVISNDFKKCSLKGNISRIDLTEAYKKHIISFAKKIEKMRVVIDCANGMASQDFSLIRDELPIDVVPLYFEIDGRFPNHPPDPMKKGALDTLKKRVIKEKADLGIALDGDADRVFFIDEKGEIIPVDFIIALIVTEILKENHGETVLYDIRSSWIVAETIEANGGRHLMSKVGHSFIKELMRKENAIFAGELSGHFYFRDNFFTDSGILTVILVLNLISAKGKKISELVMPLRKYFAIEEMNFKVQDKEGKIKQLAEKYKDGRISWLDGIRVDYDDWWFNVRSSNTEPLLRLNLEAKSKKLMEEKRDELLAIIQAS